MTTERYLAALLLILPVSCSSLPNSSSQTRERAPLQLSQVERLVVGKTTQSAANATFGDPDMKASPSELPGEEAWLYLEGEHRATRLSLIFTKTSGVLAAVNWYVNEDDPEADLETAKRRFNSHELTRRNAEWVGTDAAPDETYYFDKKRPLKFVYATNRKKVSAIVWTSPSDRSVAGDLNR